MHAFEEFLKDFIPKVAHKNRQLNKMQWILETTGSEDAADLKAELDTEYRFLFSEPEHYKKLLQWNREGIKEPLLNRQLNVIIRAFKQNMLSKELLKKIADQEAALLLTYANFRAEIDGRKVSDNDIREILKNENNPAKRKQAWEASKCIGDILAEKILELVNVRNQAATSLGYNNYFAMQLDLQEVDEKWLFKTLSQLAKSSDLAYSKVVQDIEKNQAKRFGVPLSELGPWAWSEPFGQEDPIRMSQLDVLVKDCDICEAARKFFLKLGFDVEPIFKKSDMFERPGKNQHAFCINIDRGEDVRTLNNVKHSIKWLETVLHEYGHAIYELGFDKKLPWLLREPPHMISTEAMALLAGRQAYYKESLKQLLGKKNNLALLDKAEESLTRRQLIFSHWVLVMSNFERSLYSNPKQDLNALWWQMVEEYQKIRPPKGRKGKNDWAAKYHIGLAPVYYFSYLLGEIFASSIETKLEEVTGSRQLDSKKAGEFLKQKLFFPGNSLNWMSLVAHVTEKKLDTEAWLTQFAS